MNIIIPTIHSKNIRINVNTNELIPKIKTVPTTTSITKIPNSAKALPKLLLTVSSTMPYNKNNVTIDNKVTPLIFKILTIEFKIA